MCILTRAHYEIQSDSCRNIESENRTWQSIASERLISLVSSFTARFGQRLECPRLHSGQCVYPMKNSESNEDSGTSEVRQSSSYSFLQLTLTCQGALFAQDTRNIADCSLSCVHWFTCTMDSATKSFQARICYRNSALHVSSTSRKSERCFSEALRVRVFFWRTLSPNLGPKVITANELKLQGRPPNLGAGGV